MDSRDVISKVQRYSRLRITTQRRDERMKKGAEDRSHYSIKHKKKDV